MLGITFTGERAGILRASLGTHCFPERGHHQPSDGPLLPGTISFCPSQLYPQPPGALE